ncbi:protein-tyrosine phosphatase-like protein [Xylaria flabelliformis]|nr:protein-tyrosine phosphatase-like protein [Xylaria flabelliformis]
MANMDHHVTPMYIKTAKPAVPYDYRAPSPPPIFIPSTGWGAPIKVLPRYDNIDPASLSARDLAIITQNGTEQIAHDVTYQWTYESRRVAQPILDYLYLGPSTVVRDRQWLQEKGITMILAVRDLRQASLNLMAFDELARELGIEAQYVDASGDHELVHLFPAAVRMINDHMLRVYRDQAVPTFGDVKVDESDEVMVIDEARFRRGRVLVFCETGNDRSAGIVSAYLMAVLGMTAVQAMQFINRKRFCVCMREDLKRALATHEDILVAQRTVHRHELLGSSSLTSSGTVVVAGAGKRTKRGIDDTMDDDGDDGMTGIDIHQSSDRDRFLGRADMTPFVDA